VKAALDELIHQPARLRLMAALTALAEGDSLDFSYLKDFLGLSDGNLGAHLRRLEEAGYIKVEKAFVDRKPRSFVSASAAGREAYRAHLLALEEIISAAGVSRAPAPKKGG
jgi:DNA-binding MarR family transcriptional regulator